MTNQEVIKKLNDQTNFGIKKCKQILCCLQDIIIDALKKGQEINFCKLGKMKIKRITKARFYNPFQKSFFEASPKNKVIFCANKNFVDTINF